MKDWEHALELLNVNSDTELTVGQVKGFIRSLLASEKKALLKKMEEVIGEDEELPKRYLNDDCFKLVYRASNELRKEQRAKLEQLKKEKLSD